MNSVADLKLGRWQERVSVEEGLLFLSNAHVFVFLSTCPQQGCLDSIDIHGPRQRHQIFNDVGALEAQCLRILESTTSITGNDTLNIMTLCHRLAVSVLGITVFVSTKSRPGVGIWVFMASSAAMIT